MSSGYDKSPIVRVYARPGDAVSGWDAIGQRLRAGGANALAIECYVGVSVDEIASSLRPLLGPALWVDMRDLLLPEAAIAALVASDMGDPDSIFGRLSGLELAAFLDPAKVDATRATLSAEVGRTIVIGPGASLVAGRDAVLVYADLPRWEAQQRHRRGEAGSLGAEDAAAGAAALYKRAFFVDWRVCDRLKRETMARWDYLLDTTMPGEPSLVTGDALRVALAECAHRPFRLVPFFDPGPWGGQWMRERFDLDPGPPNFAWAFDCVPEENSLRLDFAGTEVELPALDLVFAEPEALLGRPVHRRFGAEFPIRFDMLDTMGGGNLSLQVHPRADYIREQFGMGYTQDESYYLLDAGDGATVYLGHRPDIDPDAMFAALERANGGEADFDDGAFVTRFPVRKHDHLSIPAGTLHCSGRDAMVLEISATPYIFTFKLWDWNRLGLDGKPRPINLAHGRANLIAAHDGDFARRELVDRVEDVARGDGWREERTGLHPSQFIETRRHWFTAPVEHDTGGLDGSVHVLNLVEGDAAVIESPEGAFAPFVLHYVETVVVPAAVGRYRIRPTTPGASCATIKASIRLEGDA